MIDEEADRCPSLLTDMALYGLIVPIMQLRLQSLGYDSKLSACQVSFFR